MAFSDDPDVCENLKKMYGFTRRQLQKVDGNARSGRFNSLLPSHALIFTSTTYLSRKIGSCPASTTSSYNGLKGTTNEDLAGKCFRRPGLESHVYDYRVLLRLEYAWITVCNMKNNAVACEGRHWRRTYCLRSFTFVDFDSPFFFLRNFISPIYPTNLRSLHQSPTFPDDADSLPRNRRYLIQGRLPILSAASINPSVWFARGGSPRARIPRPYHYFVTLHETIIDEPYVYVVFELCAGGHTFQAIVKEG
ncbi:hypothetical protein ARMGADRAFT_1089280 [Armillaria gallica]|uniref:Uncharacterized protein n=1 Tax=Armillaria gallica TaxID=47427 RepID=A0A2H3CY68_ARMGA|nr:hypothetical protein ARMGADRAFT_1089280 [Armillaria gallica]